MHAQTPVYTCTDTSTQAHTHTTRFLAFPVLLNRMVHMILYVDTKQVCTGWAYFSQTSTVLEAYISVVYAKPSSGLFDSCNNFWLYMR